MFSASDVVLVTGATGFTGQSLCRRLSASGCKVRAIARASSDRSALADLDIEWFIGEVYDATTVRRATAGVDVIFHLAAAYREARIADEVYHQVHVESTRRLAEAARANPGFRRFVHVSTVGVLGHIEHPPADESTPYNPGDRYQETKTEAERWLLDYAGRHPLPLTVVRPAAIYGPGDRRLLKVFKLAGLPVVPLLGSTRGLYHLIHVEDLVSFLLAVAEAPQALGQVYICGNPQPLELRELIATIARHLGREPRFVRLPAWPFFLLGDLCERVCRPLGLEPPIYRRRVAFFTKDRAFDTGKMRRELGFKYRFSNESGLQQTADWYLAQGWLRAPGTPAEDH